MQKTDKVLRLKSKLGHTLQVVREHYVRPDVPCQSSLCLASCQNIEGTLAVLPGNDQVTHYVVPDCQAARDYLEILEFPEITGIIFMQTTAHSVQHEGGRRLHNRLKNLVKDVRKASIVFHNEFQQYAYCARQAGQTLQQWQARSVYEAAVWYYHHLAAQMPIVMLSNNPQVIAEYGSKNLGVFVLSVQDYLKNFWQRLTAAHDLYESLSAALQEARSTDHDYTGYMPMEVLESGIKSGRYIQGSLQVNKHNAQLEAFVRRTG